MRVPALAIINLSVKTDEQMFEQILLNSQYLRKLARVGKITNLKVNPAECAYGVVSGMEFFIPLKGLIDVEKERERLKQELEKLKKFHLTLRMRLENENFIKKAPSSEIENTKSKFSDTNSKIEKITENLKYL
jgi:valyl-tRNA synthetase